MRMTHCVCVDCDSWLRARLWELETGECSPVQSAETGPGQAARHWGQLQSESRPQPGIIQGPVDTHQRCEGHRGWHPQRQWHHGECVVGDVGDSDSVVLELDWAVPGQLGPGLRARVIAPWDWRQQPGAASLDTAALPPRCSESGQNNKMVAESRFNTGPVCPCPRYGLCRIRVVVCKLDRKNVQYHANPVTTWY